MAESATVKVVLLAGRTGYGRRGDVVDYPRAECERHSQPPFETVRLYEPQTDQLIEPPAKPAAKPAKPKRRAKKTN